MSVWVVLLVPALVLLVVLLFAFTGCAEFKAADEPPAPGTAAPPGPLSRVQAQSGTGKGSATAIWSPATSAQTLLVAIVAVADATDVISPPSTDWVKAVGGPNASGPLAEIWYFANNPGGRTSEKFTCPDPNGALTLDIREYAGAALTAVLDKYSGNGDDRARTAISTGPAGPVAASGVAVAALCNRNAATSQTPPTNGHASVSNLTEGQNLRTQATEKLGGLSSNEQTGTTLDTARPWSAAIAVFKSASA
jgi:phage gp37-like protein